VPFLILVCLGVVLVLAFNLFKALFSSSVVADASLHVVRGNFSLKTWGSSSYHSFNEDSLLVQGDSVRVADGGLLIIEFFDGTLMRANEGSEFRIELMRQNDEQVDLEVELLAGDIWFNHLYKQTTNTSVKVFNPDLEVVRDQADIYSFTANPQAFQARVLSTVSGNNGVLVSVLSEPGGTEVESEVLGIAQEAIFTSEVLAAYRDFRSPTVLQGINQDYLVSDWYLWNIEQDRSPTALPESEGGFVKVLTPEDDSVLVPTAFDDEVNNNQPSEEAPVDSVVENEEEPEVETEQPAELGSLSTPTIVSVAGVTNVDEQGFYNIDNPVGILKGEISGASQVEVNGYVLKQFTPGDSSWQYFANANYGLMQEGENTYEIIAKDARGQKSEALVVKVRYTPKAEEPQTEEGEQPTTEEGQETPGAAAESDIDGPI
jgi:hypothetical protein